jgi:hypothetical protein
MQLIYIKEFITNKLHFFVDTVPLLHVSAIIYSRLQGAPIYVLKDVYNVSTQLCKL